MRCGRKRVARLMRDHRLVGVHLRRRWRTARHGAAVHGVDLVRRNFNPSGPNQLWAADVTQFHTGEGWLYLAAVLDLWSRRVIGWAIGAAVNAELVGDALVMAFQRRRPDQRVVHHSDRGAVYTSLAFSARLAQLELDQSFSAVGSCYDKACVSHCTSWRGLGGNSVSDRAALPGDQSGVAGFGWLEQANVLVVGLVRGE